MVKVTAPSSKPPRRRLNLLAAIDAAKPSTETSLENLSIDTGISQDALYLKSSTKARAPLHLEAKPGVNVLKAPAARNDVKGKLPPKVASSSEATLIAPALDPRHERLVFAKERRKEHLDGWFGIGRREMTPEASRELQALQLRAVANPRRFYRSGLKKLPTHFQFATVVEGGLSRPVGVDTPIDGGRRRRKKASLLKDLLNDEQVQEFTKAKYAEMKAAKNAAQPNKRKKKTVWS